MCKWVLSRGSERTLAGRTRGCGGLLQGEIQEVGGPEEKSLRRYRDWRRDEVSLKKLSWKYERRVYKKGKNRRMIQFCSFLLKRVKGPLLKLSSLLCSHWQQRLTQWLTMTHVTAQWMHRFPPTDNCWNTYWRDCAWAQIREPCTHLSTRHRAKGVGWPHHRLGVHHGGWIHHPHRAHLWRLQCGAQRSDMISKQYFSHTYP